MSRTSRTEKLQMNRPPGKAGGKALAISCGILVLVTIGWTSVCAGLVSTASFLVNPVLTVYAAIAAATLGFPYLVAILWLDRNEREPPLLLASAFLWGAVIATMISSLFNDTVGLTLLLIGFPDDVAHQLMASFSAPFIEELSKGAALVALYVMFRNHLDNVLDGVVYGALVGLGFAVFENFMYYVNSGDIGAATVLICLRGVMTSPGTHACFTAIVGVSFGLFRVWRVGAIRWLFVPAGVLLAMFVHFSWNTFTNLFMGENDLANFFVGIPMAVVVLQMPFVVLVLTVSALALRHERQLIDAFLTSESEPVLYPGELDDLVPARKRTLRSLRHLLTFDFAGWWTHRRRCDALVELAFEKWHMNADADHGLHASASAHADRVQELRRILRELPPPPA